MAHHGSEWTVEEDALAFLTDAGLVGRLAMSQQGRWPKDNTKPELEHKFGECIWWLTVLADRMDMNIAEALELFLTKTEKLLEKCQLTYFDWCLWLTIQAFKGNSDSV